MQRARDRRRRHGKHIDFSSHLLDTFFVADAKALFFIDHQQTEVGELHIFREQTMRADQDIDLTRLDSLQNFFDLLRRTEAADHFDRQRERSEALLGRLEQSWALESQLACYRSEP